MKSKKEFSKILCVISILSFVFFCLIAATSSFLGFDGTVFMYVIPATGAVAATCLGFYFFKSKSENMIKLRLRFVLMKVLLESKLDPETYQEVCAEIDNIDSVINEKLNSMVSDSINTEDGGSSIPTDININI